MEKLVVVAIGGNSLVKESGKESIQDQYEAVCKIASNIADLIEEGCGVVVTHGNGPQVGIALRRCEIANDAEQIPMVPLVNCVADTQGGIGYQIQQALTNEFIARKINKKVVTIITQVEVRADDPNFNNPTKPVGSFYTYEQFEALRKEHPDWVMVEDSGRGYRRVVPSPKPIDILEKDVIRSLIDSGYIVVAVGGGGIPVVKADNGKFSGIDAVIDKDFATSLLAEQIQADALIMTTGVPKVFINYGKPNQQALETVTINETRKYMEENHFPAGSMLPKIEASLLFLDKSGTEVIITNPESMKDAISNNAGTHIVK